MNARPYPGPDWFLPRGGENCRPFPGKQPLPLKRAEAAAMAREGRELFRSVRLFFLLLGEKVRMRASQNPVLFSLLISYPPRHGTPRVRKKKTWAEKLMWRWLRDRRFSD